MSSLVSVSPFSMTVVHLPVYCGKAKASDMKDGATRAYVPALLATVLVQCLGVHQHERCTMGMLHPAIMVPGGTDEQKIHNPKN